MRANIFFVCKQSKQSQRIFRKSSNQEEIFKFLKTEVCLKPQNLIGLNNIEHTFSRPVESLNELSHQAYDLT